MEYLKFVLSITSEEPYLINFIINIKIAV